MSRARRSLACLFLLAAACGGAEESAAPTRARAAAPAAGANLLLVTLDTTRADRLGAYGHAAAQTPHLDGLARDGVRFARAYAQVPLTLPSHASLLTGAFPPEHGLHVNGRAALGPELTTLAEVFRVHGYRTGAFVAALALDGSFGLERGFDVYGDDLGPPAADGTPPLKRPGDQVVDEALAWLRAGDAPFFAWVHLYDPHDPYEPPAGFALADPYDGEVAFMDAQIGRLLGWLDAQRLADSTLVVAVADHGESLGEHGEGTHAAFLYEGTQHIPWIVRGPGVTSAGSACDDLVQQVDLFPTVLELFGWPRLAQTSGRSLAPALRGEALAPATVYLESDYCALNFGWSPLRGVVDGRWKLIQAPTRELYDLRADPHEAHDLAAQHPEVVEALQRRLDDLRAGMQAVEAQAVAPTSALVRALSELGYAQGEGDAFGEVAVGRNPMELADVLTLYHQALPLGHQGRAAEMVAPLEEVVRRVPDSAGFQALLGQAYLAADRADDAVAALQRALALDERNAPACYYLGHALEADGRTEDAAHSFERALELNPRSVLARRDLGRLLLRSGQPERGLAELRAALADDPDSVAGWTEFGDACAGLGRWVDARAALERAHELAPGDDALAGFLAWVLATAPDAEARDGARALALAEPLARATPTANALDTLAAAYAELGRWAEAVSAANAALERAAAEGDEALARGVRERLAGYEAQRPFRDG
ncbi:MAG: sulfatase-like hydrolase/transferase [Planctomycetes bacterium]|nr:sulfatase-like hydrolase/transferase [Planctomycetota bacterium]